MISSSLILQHACPGGSVRSLACQDYSVPGLSYPCRIVIYACDGIAAPMAAKAHALIEANLSKHVGTPKQNCGGLGLLVLECRTWLDNNRSQILVPVIGKPVSKSVQRFILNWQNKAGPLGLITPAILPGLNHSTVFANLSRLNSISWSGKPKTLASAVLQRALHDHRPGLFISYRRAQASDLVDQLYDKLSQNGFRIFLDRFSGTPGRCFPEEIAEQLADKAVVLVIETSDIRQSKWTQYELSFARLYRLGILALNLQPAPIMSRITQRRYVTTKKGILDPKDLSDTVEFIQREWNFAALRRRAFYEGLVAGAASVGGGAVDDQDDGFFLLKKKDGTPSALISPSGRPGGLRDIRPLAEATMPKVKKLLLGQHRHLPQRAYDDLYWLTQKVSIELHDGYYDSLQRIKELC